MYFYIAYSSNNDPIKGVKKIGITSSPTERIKPYKTFDHYIQYYKLISFTNITINELKTVEQECLAISIKYGVCSYNSGGIECRYGISKEDLYLLCQPILNKYVNCEVNIDQLAKIKNPTNCDLSQTITLDLLHNMLHINSFPFMLKGYQANAYQKMIEIYMSGSRIINLNIMCRCGKSILFFKFINEFYNEFSHIIYVSSRLALINDMYDRACNIFKDIFKYVGLNSSGSDINITQEQFNGYIEKNNKLFVFTCVESFERVIDLLSTYENNIIIFDEVHYLCTTKNVNNPLMHMKQFTNKHLQIMCTATPIVGKYNILKNNIFANDPEFFGADNHIVYNDASNAELNNFICPVRLFITSFDEKSNNVDRAIATIKKFYSTLDEKEYTPRKLLAYVNSIASIQKLYKHITEDTDLKFITPYQVSSNEKNSVNVKTINEFKNNKNTSILINCQMLAAGINIDELDTILLVDEKYKKEEIIQIIFRPRNYLPNKIAHIIIPQIKSNISTSTTLTVITELYKYNDPSVVKSSTASYLSCYGGLRNLNLKNNIIDSIIEAEIIDFNNILLSKQMTMKMSIVEVLKEFDHITATEIWNKISEKKYYIPPKQGKTPVQTCNAQCHDLAKIGIIGVDKTKKPNLFYKINGITTNVFEGNI